MEQRPLGLTGLTVSALGFGCGSVGGLMVRGQHEDQRAAVARALDAGVTYFDTAPSYGDGRSEENLGRALGELDAWQRVAVGTKVRLVPEELRDAAGAVRRSLQASLARLGRDSVDLLQLHSRIGGASSERGIGAGEVSDIVADAMRQVCSEGLVRHVGITALGESESVLAVIGGKRFDTAQTYFNALNPSAGFAGASGGAQDLLGVIDAAAEAGMGVIAIRVLAAGAATGSEERAPNASLAGGGALTAGGDFHADIERAKRLAAVASRFEIESVAELSFRFCLAKHGVSTVLVGFSNTGQLEDALRWHERGPLTPNAVEAVVAAARTA